MSESIFSEFGAWFKNIFVSEREIILRRLSVFEGLSGFSVSEIQEKYKVQESPYRDAIISTIDRTIHTYSSNAKELRFAENAMYYIVIKRWSTHSFEGDRQTYLSRLRSDISCAKREYVETNYESDAASNTFSQFHTMLSILIHA